MTSAGSRVRSEMDVLLLAAITLAAYGCWIYSFGVLLEPMVSDLGASEPSLVAAFGAAQLLAGFGSIAAGRALDRLGSRPVFVAGACGAGVLALSGFAATPGVFIAAFVVGAGVVSAAGFYHISQTGIARLAPGRETQAIARLTLYAALSAPIYYPLTAALVSRFDWRVAIRVEAIGTMALFVLGAAVAGVQPAAAPSTRRFAFRGLDRKAVRYAGAVMLIGATIQILSVYQVPVMVAGGLSLGAASTFAGGRGLAQFAGRLPINRVVGSLGAAATLRGALLLMAAGSVVLGLGGIAAAAVGIVLVGVAVGAVSPMVGIRGREVFDESLLGASLGAVTMGTFVTGAIGPALAGVLVDATGTRMAAIALAAAVALGAAIWAGGE